VLFEFFGAGVEKVAAARAGEFRKVFRISPARAARGLGRWLPAADGMVVGERRTTRTAVAPGRFSLASGSNSSAALDHASPPATVTFPVSLRKPFRGVSAVPDSGSSRSIEVPLDGVTRATITNAPKRESSPKKVTLDPSE
jgi:hypothetical protein